MLYYIILKYIIRDYINIPYTTHYTLYTIRYALYTIHYTLYTVHYTLYAIL